MNSFSEMNNAFLRKRDRCNVLPNLISPTDDSNHKTKSIQEQEPSHEIQDTFLNLTMTFSIIINSQKKYRMLKTNFKNKINHFAQ